MSSISRRTLLRASVAGSVATAGLSRVAWAQKRGGTTVIAISGEPTAIVGFLHTDTGGFNIASNIYSGLIGLDNNFNPTRNLADSWDMAPYVRGKRPACPAP
jgi:peptide/nickel transport system substrate-binding protein